MSTSAIVAYAAAPALPVAARSAGHSALALSPRTPAGVSGAGRPDDPLTHALLVAAARTRPRSPTLGTLIDTWA